MLSELVAYSEAHLDSEPGFKAREVRWCLELATDGRFLNVIPLGDGKNGEQQSRCPDMHGMNAGGKSHFLVETAQTAVLLFKNKEDPKKIATAEDRHRFFFGLLRQAAESVPILKPLAKLPANASLLSEVRAALATHGARPSDWIGWRIGNIDPRLNEDVQVWWREWRCQDLAAGGKESVAISKPDLGDTQSGAMVCFLTGESMIPLATHPKITGLSGVGGLAMGDVMVGFDKAAFGSYGLDQSANAAMSAEAVQKYVDGLNDLIKNHARKLANALVVHWFKERIPPEDDPLTFLLGFETPEQTESAALASVRRLLDSIRSGQRANLGDNRYYALTVSGAAGRVMVRDWMEGRFEDLAQHVEAWFSDLAIVAWDGSGIAFDPKFYEVCLGLVRNDRSKSISENLKQLPAPTATTLWRVAVQQLPVPQPLMTQALIRFRADLIKDEPFNHARMGLLRAYFVRKLQGGDSKMTAHLNPDHPEAAYHCGRLMAVLAELQYAALGDVGAGVVQRYYAAASQTPGLILGRLVRNSQNHLNKPDKPWLASKYEIPMMNIMERLKDRFPRVLDLEGQGLFALGYYQQLAALRARKSTQTATEQGETK